MTGTVKLRVAAVGYATVESLPLFHYMPGSTVARVVVGGLEAPIVECEAFEICRYARGEEALQLHEVPLDEIIYRARRWGVDSIVFEGPEPLVELERVGVERVVEEARSRGLRVGLRTFGLSDPPPGLFDFILFDYVAKYAGSLRLAIEEVDALERLASDSGTWLEVAVYLREVESYEDLSPVIRAVRERKPPLHVFVEHHKGGATITRLREDLRGRLPYYYIHNKPYEYLDTYCPKCGSPLIVRDEGMLKVSEVGDDGSCWKCGYKVSLIGPARRKTPRRVLLLAKGGTAWYPPRSLGGPG